MKATKESDFKKSIEPSSSVLSKTLQTAVAKYSKTCKEEARELIVSFYPFVDGIDKGERHRAARQCALLTCNKILNELEAIHNGELMVYRWQEIKTEIKKLRKPLK